MCLERATGYDLRAEQGNESDQQVILLHLVDAACEQLRILSRTLSVDQRFPLSAQR
jgi:hypothetical protein